MKGNISRERKEPKEGEEEEQKGRGKGTSRVEKRGHNAHYFWDIVMCIFTFSYSHLLDGKSEKLKNF